MGDGNQPHRMTLGPKFSEAARRLWMIFEKGAVLEKGAKPEKLTFAEMSARVGLTNGAIYRFAYGDKRPSSKFVDPFFAKLGIEPAWWNEAPKKQFVPPAARPERSGVAA
jgi:hypothetical protein